MSKLKTKKAVKKRVRISKNGKVIRNKAGRRHLNSHQRGKTGRNLARKATCTPGDAKKIVRMLGNTRP